MEFVEMDTLESGPPRVSFQLVPEFQVLEIDRELELLHLFGQTGVQTLQELLKQFLPFSFPGDVME